MLQRGARVARHCCSVRAVRGGCNGASYLHLEPASRHFFSTSSTTTSDFSDLPDFLRNEVLYGTRQLPPRAPVQLTAGNVTVSLCSDGGGVLSIDFGGTQVSRGISFVHRDSRWGTPSVELSEPVMVTDRVASAPHPTTPTGIEFTRGRLIKGALEVATLLWRLC